jgi:HSP20 family protein
VIRTPPLPPPRLAADIYETPDGDAYIVEIPVPGLEVSQISIEATPEIVTVSIKRDDKNGQSSASSSPSGRPYLAQEQEHGSMSRVFDFPTDIDPDHISAILEAGMLKLHVPKAAASRPRVITLKK